MTNGTKWNWTVGGLWTSDSGWGRMIRTGQSLLANQLLFIHLGRDWRFPLSPKMTREYAISSRVQLQGLLGESLVHAYSDAGLGVTVTTDGLLSQTDVHAASHGTASTSYPRRERGAACTSWVERPVLVLFGIRLGLHDVNSNYYDTIKVLYIFPQSVELTSGRPSSSHDCVGSQTDNLFYVDPHHARPAVPWRPPPTVTLTDLGSAFSAVLSRPSDSFPGYGTTEDAGDERDVDNEKKKKVSTKKSHKLSTQSSSGGNYGSNGGSYQMLQAMSGSPSSTRTVSSFHPPLALSPLQQQVYLVLFSIKNRVSGFWQQWDMDYNGPMEPSVPEHDLTPLEEYYATAYSVAELKTFHCDRILIIVLWRISKCKGLQAEDFVEENEELRLEVVGGRDDEQVQRDSSRSSNTTIVNQAARNAEGSHMCSMVFPYVPWRPVGMVGIIPSASLMLGASNSASMKSRTTTNLVSAYGVRKLNQISDGPAINRQQIIKSEKSTVPFPSALSWGRASQALVDLNSTSRLETS
ncbi:MAG: hypothetical protein NXY57DRAFT_1089299 [Lentinula lateritia]|nr:MAG: hypothetical protein NXY57DRAFT_1089299 [Lentinula lateritia]